MTDQITDILTRGVTNTIVADELKAMLNSGKPLRIKLGIDPTGPKLHLGRVVVLRKLRAFQKMGHQIVLIIGDFTALVGDASDKDSERPMLTREDIEENMKHYLPQIGRVLDMENVEVRYNSEWLAPLGFYEIAKLAQKFSVAEMLDRDNFSNRYKNGKRISLHEFLYPLMQGYDSVAVRADIELGGNDQLFNLLAGRTLQKGYDQKPQCVITTELIEGTDGRKMSTSWGNAIYLEDEANDMYGKVMRITDELIVKYFINCTEVSMEEITRMQDAMLEGANPRDMKARLAKEIVRLYHGDAAADAAEQDFITKFVKHETPEDIPTFTVVVDKINIVELLTDITHFASSKSEARRLIEGGGVSVDGTKITSHDHQVNVTDGKILKVGKRKFGALVRE